LVCRGVLFSTASERVNWTSKHSRPRQGIVRNEDVRGTHEFCRIECDREARRVNDRLGDITFECLFVKIRRLYEKTRVVVMYPKRTITNTTSSIGLDPGQTRPSMGQVSMGRKVNRLTDPSVEQVGICRYDC
jgi:hypothetical protein